MEIRTDARFIARMAVLCSLAAALLLVVMCTITLVTGTSQQTFESFMPPDSYAHGLVRGAHALRTILSFDDVFIVAYTAAILFVCVTLSAGRFSPVLSLVLLGGVTGGVLDMLENHHILSMLRRAEFGYAPSLAELDGRVVASSFKWMLAHESFALLGLVLEVPGWFGRVLKIALVAVQLPLGVLTLVVADPSALIVLTWIRYASLLAGFLSLAFIARDVPVGRPAMQSAFTRA